MSKNDKSASSKGTTVSKSASRGGQTVWVVRHKDGKSERVVTSKTSNTVIQRGVVTYNNALKNLAKR
jgi:hypothetical protein